MFWDWTKLFDPLKRCQSYFSVENPRRIRLFAGTIFGAILVSPVYYFFFDHNDRNIFQSGAILNKTVPDSSKVVPLGIRVKTLVIIGFIYYLFLLLAPFKKKVVPSLKVNNINRLPALWHHFLMFYQRSFQ